MFEEFAGLPLHPLAVHAPIALVPLLIAVALGYALVPWLRRWFGWTVVALAIMAPLSVLVARQSGHAFRERLARLDQLPPERAARIDEHAALSLPLIWLTLGLAVASVLMVLAVTAARPAPASVDPDGDPPRRRAGLTVVTVLLAIAVLALSGATGWYLFEAGDSGARMVWEGS